jgi:hypothetical protein
MTEAAAEAGGTRAAWTGILPKIRGSFLEEALVLLPASRVRQWEETQQRRQEDVQADEEGEEDGGPEDSAGARDCLAEKRQQWIKLNTFLKQEIEDSFPVRRWVPARNLMKGVLRCKELCVTPDYRKVFVKAHPKWQFGIIDFLALASRKAGPGEQESEKVRAYRPLVNILLKNNVPETFFVNRLLLEAAVSGNRRGGRRRRRHPPSVGGRPSGGREGRRGGFQGSSGPLWQPPSMLYSQGWPPPGWFNGGHSGGGGSNMTHLYHV